MNEDVIKKLIENNAEITRLMLENETLIRDEGFAQPVRNYSVDKDSRIGIPAYYIRRVDKFVEKYHLNEIVLNETTKKNISYALQVSDFYNYLVNRFNIWGSIEIMLYKQMLVNLVSIIEALIVECATDINLFCQQCPQIGKCEKNIARYDRGNMKLALQKLVSNGVFNFEENEKDRIIELYDLRNKIHIRLNEQNEFMNNIYNRDLYNEAIMWMQKVDEQIWKNGVQFYSNCMGFVDKNP